MQSSNNAPKAQKIPKVLTCHGETRMDYYYWLNDRDNEEVVNYLKAENEYLEEKLSHIKQFRQDLFLEMKSRIKEDDQSVPYKDNGYFYITRYEKGKEYPIYSRKKDSLEAPEELLLEVNDLAKDFSYFKIGGFEVSLDNKLMAYSEDIVSRRIYTIRFKNLDTGEMLEDIIPNTSGNIIWANDNKTLFYAVKDDALRPYKIFRHKLGTPVAKDVEIWHEADDTFRTYIYKTKSDRFLIIGSDQTVTSEYRILDADDPEGTFSIFQERTRGLEYDLAHFKDDFFVRTNLNARNFRLMKTPVDATEKSNWTEVIPHREDVLLEDMDIFNDYLVLSERIKGITQLRIMPTEGSEHYIHFHDEAHLTATSVNLDFDTDILRISYQSMTTPPTVYDYHMKTRVFKLMKQQEVVGDFDPENYESERFFVPVRDGVQVPVSVVYRKGYQKDGNAPLLQYAYGSYGHSMEPYFSSIRLSLLDRGFAFAIAHVRGGEEMGRHWYDDGRLLKKKNTFTDFIDCAKYLVGHKYTSTDRLFAMGGSAGGLLMGAIINMAPELWKGVLAAVPFVDVVTTMLDDSIPLTTGEYDEWGNPNEKEFYDYIKSYSPYDNVEAKEYPAMLVTTGLHDSQVQYWEPAKWVAKLREMKTDDNILLMHTNMEAGHGGASGRFEAIKEIALEYAFILDLAGKIEGEKK